MWKGNAYVKKINLERIFFKDCDFFNNSIYASIWKSFTNCEMNQCAALSSPA